MKNIVIGVLSLQGDFKEHINMLEKLKINTKEIRFPVQLEHINGLIIPGGESTTINKLFDKYGFRKRLLEFSVSGRSLFGTCAGLIVLAKRVIGEGEQLGLIDIDVKRNAFGRQIDSFEHKISLKLNINLGKRDFNSVFIRAPKVVRAGKNVKVIGKHKNEIVLARQANILVSAFHPELTKDTRIHQYFMSMVKDNLKE